MPAEDFERKLARFCEQEYLAKPMPDEVLDRLLAAVGRRPVRSQAAPRYSRLPIRVAGAALMSAVEIPHRVDKPGDLAVLAHDTACRLGREWAQNHP